MSNKKALYNSARWIRLRKSILIDCPLCVRCSNAGITVLAEHVDHCIGFSDKHDTLATDIDNLFPLCVSCHSEVTHKEKNGEYDGMSIDECKAVKYAKVCIGIDGYVIEP
jgi:5-methylcytosine-specific restriction endonuclease McrA